VFSRFQWGSLFCLDCADCRFLRNDITCPRDYKASRLRLQSSYLQLGEPQTSHSLQHFLGHRLFQRSPIYHEPKHFLRCYRCSPCPIYLLLRLEFVTN
jgi:hypothetical protein